MSPSNLLYVDSMRDGGGPRTDLLGEGGGPINDLLAGGLLGRARDLLMQQQREVRSPVLRATIKS